MSTNNGLESYNLPQQVILKFPRVQMVPIGLLIFVGFMVACGTTQSPTDLPDLDATVTASIKDDFPDRTPTASPDIYATVQAQIRLATPTSVKPITGSATPLPTATPALSSSVESVRPSVVRIVTNRGSGSGFIFQMGFPTPGSGDTALVVTNYHVIENASQIRVTVNDSTTLTGTILGIDPSHNLAALTICCGQFQPLVLTDTDDPPVGSRAIVFGYATGVPGAASITDGNVSDTRFEDGQWVIETGSATDAGNSGGPLISLSGALLGINTYRSGEAGGFAISQKTLRDRIPDLISGDLLLGPTPTPTPGPTATPTPASYLLAGQSLFDRGLYDAAIIEFTKAIDNDKEFGQAYAWRGRSNMELAKNQEAIADLSQALLRDPADVNFYRWRGEAYTGLKIYIAAIVDYGQVISRDPIPTADDYHGLGFARFSIGEYWQAIDDFTEAIVLEPTAERFELRGASYFQTAGDVLPEQLWSAISDFNQAINMDATASVYKQRGDTYSKLGNDVRAEADWDQACILVLSYC